MRLISRLCGAYQEEKAIKKAIVELVIPFFIYKIGPILFLCESGWAKIGDKYVKTRPVSGVDEAYQGENAVNKAIIELVVLFF